MASKLNLMVLLMSSLLILLNCRESLCLIEVTTVTSWKQLEFGFPTEAARQNAINNGDLNPQAATPIDVQPFFRNSSRNLELLVSIPRFVDGIPYTLASITMQSATNGLVLQPYPNLNFHNRGKGTVDCNRMTSVFRVSVSECNELFVLDSGVVGSTQVCPPQILVFNLSSDALIQRYTLPSSLYVPGVSLYITPTLVVNDPPPSGRCQNTKVYMADVTGFGIGVYDRATNSAWRTNNRYMFPNPDFGLHTIAGEQFILMDGIFSLVNDKTNIYFHPLASINEFAVSLSVLNNQSAWNANPQSFDSAFLKLGKRPSECAAEAIDSFGLVYCVTFNPIQLFVWDSRTPYTSSNFYPIAANPDYLQFVSGMKVFKNKYGTEELWLMSNRFQKIAAGTLNATQENFRITRRPLTDIQQYFGASPITNDLQNSLIFSS